MSINTRRCPNAGLMLAHRRRRLANINPALRQRIVLFVGLFLRIEHGCAWVLFSVPDFDGVAFVRRRMSDPSGGAPEEGAADKKQHFLVRTEKGLVPKITNVYNQLQRRRSAQNGRLCNRAGPGAGGLYGRLRKLKAVHDFGDFLLLFDRN